MSEKPSKPVLIELEAEALNLPETFQESPLMQDENPALPLAPKRRGAWVLGATAGLLVAVLVGLFGLYLTDTIAALLIERPWLGRVFAALVGLFVAGMAVLGLREWRAFSRLSRITRLRETLGNLDPTTTRNQSLTALRPMLALYRKRPDVVWGLQRFDEQSRDLVDADAFLDLAEAEVLKPLDQAAVAEIEKAARQVAVVTAIVPLALADVAIALVTNLRMIRRLAEIYGGRTGGLGSLRLLRLVFLHLTATGLVAVGDDLISSIAGGGLVSKVSRRFGEGVVNGAMTARIGIAAMELCRPMPFRNTARPKVRNLVTRALKGVFTSN